MTVEDLNGFVLDGDDDATGEAIARIVSDRGLDGLLEWLRGLPEGHAGYVATHIGWSEYDGDEPEVAALIHILGETSDPDRLESRAAFRRLVCAS